MKAFNWAVRLGAVLVGATLSSGVWADSFVTSVSSSATASPVTATLYSLGAASTSIDYDALLPATNSSATNLVEHSFGVEQSNINYNADGSIASYTKRSYELTSFRKVIESSFTLSAKTLAVFNVDVSVGGSFQTCAGSNPFMCSSGNSIMSGTGYGNATLSAEGVGYYGVGSQSDSASRNGSISVTSLIGPCGTGCTSFSYSSSFVGNTHGYISDPSLPSHIVGEYASDRGLLSVVFVNLGTQAATGTVSLNLYRQTKTYGAETVVTVPEADAVALVLSGLFPVGFALARRRNRI
jgi:hypothetical protein